MTRERPQFVGHYQPDLPERLGFYDLRLPEVRARQAALARAHGIHGFCYYYYWFGTKTLTIASEPATSRQPAAPSRREAVRAALEGHRRARKIAHAHPTWLTFRRFHTDERGSPEFA